MAVGRSVGCAAPRPIQKEHSSSQVVVTVTLLRLLLLRCLLVSWLWLWLCMGQRPIALLCLRLLVLCMAL